MISAGRNLSVRSWPGRATDVSQTSFHRNSRGFLLRILFVFGLPAVPLATNHSGMASRAVQGVTALTMLGHELHVVRLGRPDELDGVLAFEAESAAAAATRQLVAGWQEVTVPPALPRSRSRRIALSVIDPVASEFPSVGPALLLHEIDRVRPDLLWVEATEAAALAHVRRGRRFPGCFRSKIGSIGFADFDMGLGHSVIAGSSTSAVGPRLVSTGRPRSRCRAR